MAGSEILKVLWVDNDASIIEGTQLRAEDYNIDLVHFQDWESAEIELRDHFNDYTAVILDANCEFAKGDVEDKSFLAYVMPRMAKIFGERHSDLPWYVLSAGTMEDFDLVLKLTNTIDRKKHNADWGPLLYLKDKRNSDGTTDLDSLLSNICKTADTSNEGKIRSMYADVFSILEDPSCFFDDEIAKIILPVLLALHFPEEDADMNYQNCFTSMRQAIEFMFRAANQIGMLPDVCLKDGKINIQESLRYMGGENTKHLGVRYGMQGDSIFPGIVKNNLQTLLKLANSCTHTADEFDDLQIGEYFDAVGARRLLFSHTLQFCDVICWLGKYMRQHPDPAANRRFCRHLSREDQYGPRNQKKSKNGRFQSDSFSRSKEGFDVKEKSQRRERDLTPSPAVANYIDPAVYEHQMLVLEVDENGIHHCGKVLVAPKNGIRPGDRLELIKVVANTRDSAEKYPLFAKSYAKLNF